MYRTDRMETLMNQGLSLWQAGEAVRVEQLAESHDLRGDHDSARRLRGLAIEAGNLRKGQILR